MPQSTYPSVVFDLSNGDAIVALQLSEGRVGLHSREDVVPRAFPADVVVGTIETANATPARPKSERGPNENKACEARAREARLACRARLSKHHLTTPSLSAYVSVKLFAARAPLHPQKLRDLSDAARCA